MDELIDGLIRMMESTAGFAGQVNLLNRNAFTSAQLTQNVTNILGAESEAKPQRAYNATQRQPDLTQARTKLGWVPHIHSNKG